MLDTISNDHGVEGPIRIVYEFGGIQIPDLIVDFAQLVLFDISGIDLHANELGFGMHPAEHSAVFAFPGTDV